MKLSRIILSALISWMLMVASSHAEQVKGLYDTEVVVSSQSKAALRRAASEGLATVFVRVSGDPAVLNNPNVRQARRNAESYLNKFSYRIEQPEADQKEVGQDETTLPPAEEPKLSVKLSFEAALVTKVLRKAGLPVWSSNRPSVLVWLIVDDGGGRKLANATRHPYAIEGINEHAQRRGLALKLPDAKAAVKVDQFWRMTAPVISQASRAYKADSILIGKMTRLSNGRWLGQWQYWFNNRKINFEGDAASASQFVAAGIDKIADLQARTYAIVPVATNGEGVVIQLTGIKNFTDYARAISHLESLAAVKHANVMHLQGETLIVRLEAEGQQRQLERAIALGKRFRSQPLPVGSVHPVVLSYQWVGRK